MDNKLLVRQNSGGLFVRPNFWLVTGLPKHHTWIRYWPLSSRFTRCMLQTCKLCRLTMLSLSTLTILLLVGQLSSVDIQQEYDNICSWSARNRLPLTLIKLKKLFFIGLPQYILVFRLLCQTLNKLHRLHYLDLISRPPFLSVYVDRILKQINQHLYLFCHS